MQLTSQIKSINYKQNQETLSLLKLLALGNQEVEAGRTKPLADVIQALKARKK